jgi:hypothetical protein
VPPASGVSDRRSALGLIDDAEFGHPLAGDTGYTTTVKATILVHSVQEFRSTP